MSTKLRLESTLDVAQRLKVSRRTVARLVRSGELTPIIKAPGPKGAYLFDPTEVERVAAYRAKDRRGGESE